MKHRRRISYKTKTFKQQSWQHFDYKTQTEYTIVRTTYEDGTQNIKMTDTCLTKGKNKHPKRNQLQTKCVIQ